MGYEYYLFAAYVFLLICIIILICKYLFADSKRQKKTLEEMETKLLRTYQTLEDAIDEFYDLTQESKAELEKKYTEIISSISNASLPSPEEKESVAAASKPRTKKSQPKPQAKSEPDNQPPFELLLNETTDNSEPPVSPLFENVQDLYAQGKSRAEIAKELKITQNAVELVLGMSKIQEDK